MTRYVVGIDLGTTNCALAYVDLCAEGDLVSQIKELSIPQLVAVGEVWKQALLPSNAYLPAEHEFLPEAMHLPWESSNTQEPLANTSVSLPVVVGEFAKNQGSKVPGRMISSAKSWLCHSGVDRNAPILPWGAPDSLNKISPVQASTLYLSHLKDAWRHQFADYPLEEQEVILTVPASFDEVARELTVQAAREAGLTKLRLLEEPQAAFYHWAAQFRGQLEKALGECRLILVCDVGGGTTDLTLIHAALGDGKPSLKRIAVGDHILLGGDNMDVTLARQVESRLGVRLDTAQWSMLVQSCRLAKEALLAGKGPPTRHVSVVGRSSRLVGGAMSAELTREEVLSTLLDGFFPKTSLTDLPVKSSRAGLTELGLPYAWEPAITRHIAAFLRGHAAEVEEAVGRSGVFRPDAVLLNGGVFAPFEVRERLFSVLESWFPDQGGSLGAQNSSPRLVQLSNESLGLAVARGAAYYGLVRRGLGLRIGGGTARAYFVGIETHENQKEALCVIPRHLEEETEVEVPQTFALLLDQPVRFSLYASSLVPVDKAGERLVVDEEKFTLLPPIETVLRSESITKIATTDVRRASPGKPVEVPVRLRAALTEIGTLELWCVAEGQETRWKLEFQLRAGLDDSSGTSVSPMPKRFAEAKSLVDLVFGKKPAPVDKSAVKNLVRNLEKTIGPREGWTTPVIRELWAALWAGQSKRRRTADHERIWCNLTGFCLRPGFGAPLDTWRVGEVWTLFEQGLQFQNEPHNWEAWWVLWRRIAGGLGSAEQKRIFDTLTPVLKPVPAGKTAPRLKGIKPEGIDEMIRLVASLERLSPEEKVEAGTWLFDRLEKQKSQSKGVVPYLSWAIGRLGARVPFYGSRHTCVPVAVAEEWIEQLLTLSTSRPEELAFPLAQLARMSDDRARDVDLQVRNRVGKHLQKLGAVSSLLRLVEEVVELSGGEEQKMFGESLPAGLRLLSESN